ncbi:MAG TPA: DinB family protein [Thermoanaerobaculia bacterium]|nr:DinB family protein [Thermoanaerobaculia bacterium]
MSANGLLDPHLDQLLGRARTVAAETARLASGLSAPQLLWSPQPGSWGIAACFDHLRVIGDLYYGRTRQAIEETRARKLTRTGDWRPTWFGRNFIAAAGPQVKVRLRAIRMFRPSPQPPAESWRAFLAQQETLYGLLTDADGLDLRTVRIGSPLTRLVTLRLGECLTMLVGHEERHLAQAERVRQAPGFPAV